MTTAEATPSLLTEVTRVITSYSHCKTPLGHHIFLISSEDIPIFILYPKTLDPTFQHWAHPAPCHCPLPGLLQVRWVTSTRISNLSFLENNLTNTGLSKGVLNILFCRDLANILNFLVFYYVQLLESKQKFTVNRVGEKSLAWIPVRHTHVGSWALPLTQAMSLNILSSLGWFPQVLPPYAMTPLHATMPILQGIVRLRIM